MAKPKKEGGRRWRTQRTARRPHSRSSTVLSALTGLWLGLRQVKVNYNREIRIFEETESTCTVCPLLGLNQG
jgi:hypothetical protein